MLRNVYLIRLELIVEFVPINVQEKPKTKTIELIVLNLLFTQGDCLKANSNVKNKLKSIKIVKKIISIIKKLVLKDTNLLVITCVILNVLKINLKIPDLLVYPN